MREITSDAQALVVNETDGIPAWSWISKLYLCSTRSRVALKLFSPFVNSESHTTRCLFPLRFIQTFRELPTYRIQIKPLTFSITNFLQHPVAPIFLLLRSVAPRTTPVIAEIRPFVGLGLPESVMNRGKPGAFLLLGLTIIVSHPIPVFGVWQLFPSFRWTQ